MPLERGQVPKDTKFESELLVDYKPDTQIYIQI